MAQQQFSISAPTLPEINGNPDEFTLYCMNYQHLPAAQQKILRVELQKAFFGSEITEYRGTLKVSVKFTTPVHIGQFMRRVELLIFKLRCNINAFLRFEPSFRYE